VILLRKKYFTAGLKSLGIVATPLIAAGIYNDLSSGKSVVETLERNLIGTGYCRFLPKMF
jgi:hypothetical protein